MPHVLFVSSNPKKPSQVMPARRKGYVTSLVKAYPEPADYNMFDNVIQADLFNLHDVLSKVKELDKRRKIDGVLTRFEPYTPLVGAINDMLKLPGSSLKSSLNCRDKLAMRTMLKKSGIGQPRFFTPPNVPKEAYPLLIKPTRGAKSRYIFMVDSPEKLLEHMDNIRNIIAESNHNLFKPITGIDENPYGMIAEELVRGKQVTTTTFVVNGKVTHVELADVVTSQDLGFDGFHLISRTTPSILSQEEKSKVLKTSTQAVQVLGANNCFLHPEIILTKEGPKVLEVAARVGGYRPEMNKHAFGIDLNEIAIDVSLGIEPKVKKKHNKASTAVEIWPKKSGKFVRFENLDDVLLMKGVKNFHTKKTIDNMFYSSSYGTQPVAAFFTVASTPEKSKKIADDVLNTLEVVIE